MITDGSRSAEGGRGARRLTSGTNLHFFGSQQQQQQPEAKVWMKQLHCLAAGMRQEGTPTPWVMQPAQHKYFSSDYSQEGAEAHTNCCRPSPRWYPNDFLTWISSWNNSFGFVMSWIFKFWISFGNFGPIPGTEIGGGSNLAMVSVRGLYSAVW